MDVLGKISQWRKALTTYGTAIFKAGADFVMHSLSRMR